MDVTAQYRQIRQLRKEKEQHRISRARTAAILETAADPIITITSRGIVESYNSAAERLFGYSAKEALGKNVKLLMPPPFRDDHDGYLARYLKTSEKRIVRMSREVVGKRKDGETIPLLLSVSEVAGHSDDSADSPRLFTGILRDLTEQKQWEHDLMQANQKAEELSAFGQILDSSLNEIYIFDANSLRYVHVNRGARENIGYTTDELREMTPLAITPQHTASSFEILAAPVLEAARENIQFSTVHRRKDGSEYPVDVYLQTAFLGKHRVFAAVVLDTTERERIDGELRRSREQALCADRSKSEFLANMSHETRTPMTAILGFTDILLSNLDEPENVDAVLTVQKNGQFLLELINDILDLSKIEAGKLDVERIACSPHRIVTDVVSLMQVRAKAKGLPLEVRFDGDLPEAVDTDPTRLRQILINIVGNAIKFTERGSVEVVVRLLNEPAGEALLQFDVIDTGVGIADEKIDKLFLPFTQVDASTTRQFGGTGLGLTISKRLAESLGGDIRASSALGQGSTFSVTVRTGSLDGVQLVHDVAEPAVETIVAEAATGTEASPHNRRILLAEDGPDNQRLIGYILNQAGAEVTLADNGQEALDLATTVNAEGRGFDVILMDMQMPVLDGYEATGKLREAGYRGPIIALTAHAMSSDRDKCLRAGCDDYATKPVDRGQLISLIAQYVAADTRATT